MHLILNVGIHLHIAEVRIRFRKKIWTTHCAVLSLLVCRARRRAGVGRYIQFAFIPLNAEVTYIFLSH